ncbi:MAG: hypothetical protein U1E27_10290, partial [Kiritimatiellia bacterium]|nr:hypothetical protein [Kiritimatiellia bacterium]
MESFPSTQRPGRRGFATAALTLGVLLTSAAWLMSPRRPQTDSSETSPGRVAQLLAAQLPQRHLSRRPMDSSVASNALELFLSSVDFDRSFFLQSDIDAFRLKVPDLIPMLQAGDVSLALEVFERFKERLTDRLAFAEKTLAEGLDFQRTDTYSWRRRDVPWPADPAEWDDLWRRKLQHEVLARKISVVLAAENTPAQPETRPEADKPRPPSEGDADASATPAPDAKDGEIRDANLSPEDFVLKRHRQYLIVLKDSDDEWIMDRFFSSFTRAYDPHSEYLSPVKSEDFDINMRLSLVGIGALLTT